MTMTTKTTTARLLILQTVEIKMLMHPANWKRLKELYIIFDGKRKGAYDIVGELQASKFMQADNWKGWQNTHTHTPPADR